MSKYMPYVALVAALASGDKALFGGVTKLYCEARNKPVGAEICCPLCGVQREKRTPNGVFCPRKGPRRCSMDFTNALRQPTVLAALGPEIAAFRALPRAVTVESVMELRTQRGGPDNCWLWTGDRDQDGYGRFNIGGVHYRAHRVALTLHAGPLRDDQVPDHLCRNPSCVNPAHLEAVSPQENNRRGYSVSAINARKTHCKRGHPLAGANLINHRDGRRECRTCNLAWRRKMDPIYRPRKGAARA